MIFREEALLVMKCRHNLSYRSLEDKLIRYAMGLDFHRSPTRKTFADSILPSVFHKLECVVSMSTIYVQIGNHVSNYIGSLNAN